MRLEEGKFHLDIKNKNMKKILILTSLVAGLVFSAQSQEKTQSREVGLFFHNLDVFGFRYKVGDENRKFRFTALSLSVGKQDVTLENSDLEPSEKKTGFGLGVGLEYPVKINDQFHFFYGPELQGIYNYDKTDKVTNSNYSSYIQSAKTTSYGIGLGCIIGFSYSITSNISLSAEVVPSFTYQKSKNDDYTVNTYNFELSNQQAGITISYKF